MKLVQRQAWDGRFCDRSPWMWPLAQAASRFERHADWPTRAELSALYTEFAQARGGCESLRFTDNVRKQDKRVDGRVVIDALYDARVARHHEVPTRERDWHDLFNALCFATFPRAKFALHARQLRAIERRLGADATRLPSARTREQDALTLFDEGGVAIAATAEAAAALHGSEVAALSVLLERLQAQGQAHTVPFGHALFQHLVEGLVCPGGGTRVLVLEPLPDSPRALLGAVDAALSELLGDVDAFCSPKEHLHLRFNRMQPAALRAS